MSPNETIAAAIMRFEPKLTDLVNQERAGANRASLRVASVVGLMTASLAMLNYGGGSKSQVVQSEIDALVARLPASVGQDTVLLDQIILDADILAQARSQIHGANKTNASTALALAYNLCGERDMRRMGTMTKGPLGPLGGIALVVSVRLVGMDKGPNIILELSSLLASFAKAISGTKLSSGG